MARITDNLSGGGNPSEADKSVHIAADHQARIEVPSADFIANADIAREGQDLILTAPGRVAGLPRSTTVTEA